MLQGETSDYPGTLSTAASGVATPADTHITTGRNPALQVGESLRNALAAAPTLADVKQTSVTSAAATPPSVIPIVPKSAYLYRLLKSDLCVLTLCRASTSCCGVY